MTPDNNLGPRTNIQLSGEFASGITTPPALVLEPGAVFGERFTIRKLLAHGGMGSVYVAKDNVTGENVCLKLIRPELLATPQAMERFLHEGKLARRLSHPNIARVFDIDRKRDVWFISMEFARGVNLRQWLLGRRDQGARVRLQDALWVARRLLPALAYMHGQQVVHRDLKPENIIIAAADDGKEKDLKLVDFGLARRTNAEESRQTLPGVAVGTLGYMAPEQREGKDADQRSDIYAVGAILYEMLTGAAYDGNWEPLASVRRDVPKAVEEVIQACLSKFAAQRPSDASALLARLEWASSQPLPAAPQLPLQLPTAAPLQRPSATRKLVTVGLGSSFLFAGIVFLILLADGETIRRDAKRAAQAAAEAEANKVAAEATLRQVQLLRTQLEVLRQEASDERFKAVEAREAASIFAEQAKAYARRPDGTDSGTSGPGASSTPDLVARAESAAKRAEDAEARARQAAALAAGSAGAVKTSDSVPSAPDGKEKWRQLRKGMTREQVRQLLGEPIQVVSGAFEYWYYSNSRMGGPHVSFYQDEVDGWHEP